MSGVGLAAGTVLLAASREALAARAGARRHDLVYLLDANKALGNFGLD